MRAKKMHGNEFTANRELKETPRMRTHYPYQNRRRDNTVLYVVLTIIFLVLAASVISDFEGTADDLNQRQYCDMVALGKQNADAGWPDFHGTFDAECNADGTVKER